MCNIYCLCFPLQQAKRENVHEGLENPLYRMIIKDGLVCVLQKKKTLKYVVSSSLPTPHKWRKNSQLQFLCYDASDALQNCGPLPGCRTIDVYLFIGRPRNAYTHSRSCKPCCLIHQPQQRSLTSRQCLNNAV